MIAWACGCRVGGMPRRVHAVDAALLQTRPLQVRDEALTQVTVAVHVEGKTQLSVGVCASGGHQGSLCSVAAYMPWSRDNLLHM